MTPLASRRCTCKHALWQHAHFYSRCDYCSPDAPCMKFSRDAASEPPCRNEAEDTRPKFGDKL